MFFLLEYIIKEIWNYLSVHIFIFYDFARFFIYFLKLCHYTILRCCQTRSNFDCRCERIRGAVEIEITLFEVIL